MIPLSAIVQWRSEQAPWALDEDVEQDLIISRALVDLFSEPLIAANLVFRGGTALNKLYFRPATRYSEDIDLVQVVAGEIGPILTAIRQRLDWLGKAKYESSEKLVTLTFRFETESLPVMPRKLKVEINTREHFSVEPLVKVPFEVAAPNWSGYSGTAEIVTYTFEELLATKLRALYERRKGRDVFDLAYALQRDPAPDLSKIVACFGRYTRDRIRRISRADLLADLNEKCAFPGYLEEVSAFLAPGVHFDRDADPERVRKLIAMLPDKTPPSPSSTAAPIDGDAS